MSKLTNSRLMAQLQAQVSGKAYSDSAFLIVDVATGNVDAYNNPTTTESKIPISCSFTDKPNRELWRDFSDVEEVEAEIRFESPMPTKGNRVKLTNRFASEAYKDATFEIIGISDRGGMGYVCALKAVTI
jgi:hypothetical protein